MTFSCVTMLELNQISVRRRLHVVPVVILLVITLFCKQTFQAVVCSSGAELGNTGCKCAAASNSNDTNNECPCCACALATDSDDQSCGKYGECVVARDGFTTKCKCKYGYTGRMCEIHYADKNHTIDFFDLQTAIEEESIILIDVRTRKEIEQTGIMPTAVNIPIHNGELKTALRLDSEEFKAKYGKEFKERYGIEKPTVDDAIVFTCRTGRRSLIALKLAIDIGYENTRHFPGGWKHWTSMLALSRALALI